MKIVSQDKEQIINFDNVASIEVDTTNNSIRYWSATIRGGLGTYKTAERAKEVLALIYKVYSDHTLIKHTRGDMQKDAIVGDKNKYFDVFEMPED